MIKNNIVIAKFHQSEDVKKQGVVLWEFCPQEDACEIPVPKCDQGSSMYVSQFSKKSVKFSEHSIVQ